MFKNKAWKDTAERLQYIKREYDIIYKWNNQRLGTTKCTHKRKVYLKHIPGDMWLMMCDDCGVFCPIMCGCGGSGYMCEKHIKELAEEVVVC